VMHAPWRERRSGGAIRIARKWLSR
jgi:hypothetical protein